MTMTKRWIGNQEGQKVITSFLQEKRLGRSCFLVGPHSIGKRSFVLELVSSLPEEDVLIAEPGVDGARSVIEFINTCPNVSKFRTAVVIDADSMQLPAQDAYLKVLEEPPEYSKITFISNDSGLLSEPLKSRSRLVSNWSVLSDEEMLEFSTSYDRKDDILLEYCHGRPGIYNTIFDDDRLYEFVRVVNDIIINKRNMLVEKPPKIITSIDSKSLPQQIALSVVMHSLVVKNFEGLSIDNITHMLKFSSLLYTNISVNVEMQWFNMLTKIYC